MELAYSRGKITAGELTEELPGSPSNSTVRTLLRILEEKGHLQHELSDGKYIYSPTRPVQQVAKGALQHVIDTFYQGSVSSVVTALLSSADLRLTHDELSELQKLIEEAKEEEER